MTIRAALETRLAGMSPGLATQWENAAFTPVAGTPYQAVSLVMATPQSPTIGDGFYRELGFLQVTLRYPQNAGAGAADAQARAIRAWFPRGLSLTAGGVTVTVSATADIRPGFIDGDRYAVPVRIAFFANIFS